MLILNQNYNYNTSTFTYVFTPLLQVCCSVIVVLHTKLPEDLAGTIKTDFDFFDFLRLWLGI